MRLRAKAWNHSKSEHPCILTIHYQYDQNRRRLKRHYETNTTFTRNETTCTNVTKTQNDKYIPIYTQNTRWSTQPCSRWTNSFFSSSRQIYLPRVLVFWKICSVTEHRHCIKPIKNVFPWNKNICINLATFLFSALHLPMSAAFTSSAKMLLYAIFWNDATYKMFKTSKKNIKLKTTLILHYLLESWKIFPPLGISPKE